MTPKEKIKEMEKEIEEEAKTHVRGEFNTHITKTRGKIEGYKQALADVRALIKKFDFDKYDSTGSYENMKLLKKEILEKLGE